MRLTKNLSDGNIYKNYILYALPLICSSLVSCTYSTVDAVIAGKFISENALGAISSTSSFNALFTSFFNGFAAGFAVYIAHLFGKKDYAKIKNDIIQQMTSVGLFCILIIVSAIVFYNPIFDYLKVDPILRKDARNYFILLTSSFIFTFFNLILVNSLYALGVTRFAIYISISSALINIVGNLLSVLVFDLGVIGLALSTIIAKLVATTIYITLLRRAFAELPSEKVVYRFGFGATLKSLRYTIPAAFQKLAFHCIGFIIAPVINGLGAAATTGYSVSNHMYSIAALTIWNFTSAMNCHAAQCMGLGKYDQVKKGLRVGFLLNSLALLPAVIIFMFFGKAITSLFFPSGVEGEAYNYALRFAEIYIPFLYIQMADHIFHSYLRSIGCITIVLIITTIGSTIRGIATYTLVPLISMDGVYIAQILGWLGDALLSAIITFVFFSSIKQIAKAGEKIHAKKVKT